MNFRTTLKKLPRNATLKRIFRYSQAKNFKIDPHNLINYYTAQKLLEECPYCVTKKSSVPSKIYGPNEYQKCRGRKCIKKWTVYGPSPDQFYGSIFTLQGPYWKVITHTLKRGLTWVSIEEKD